MNEVFYFILTYITVCFVFPLVRYKSLIINQFKSNPMLIILLPSEIKAKLSLTLFLSYLTGLNIMAFLDSKLLVS